MREFIIYLVRKRLGLRKYQHFKFKNQRSKREFYWFTDDYIMKKLANGNEELSGVSLNWLLNDECEVVVCDE